MNVNIRSILKNGNTQTIIVPWGRGKCLNLTLIIITDFDFVVCFHKNLRMFRVLKAISLVVHLGPYCSTANDPHCYE